MSARRFSIGGSIPAVRGWSSTCRACVSLLVFGLTALVAEWIVHQTEYLVEYGQQFGVVMETTPHRLYMSLLGASLALSCLLLCAIIALVLRVGTTRLHLLLAGLPQWIRTGVPSERVAIPLGAVLRSAGILALLQMTIYVVQENLEAWAEYADLPGLGVLLARQHATVVPLHVLLACMASLVLWTIASWLRALRTAFTVADALLRLVSRWAASPPAPRLGHAPVTPQSLAGSRRSLRSPPLAA